MNFENPLKRVERLKKVTRRPDTDLGGRIPPGQFITDKFPVLHYGAVPEVDLATWDFRVFGLVEQNLRLTWDAVSYTHLDVYKRQPGKPLAHGLGIRRKQSLG